MARRIMSAVWFFTGTLAIWSVTYTLADWYRRTGEGWTGETASDVGLVPIMDALPFFCAGMLVYLGSWIALSISRRRAREAQAATLAAAAAAAMAAAAAADAADAASASAALAGVAAATVAAAAAIDTLTEPAETNVTGRPTFA